MPRWPEAGQLPAAPRAGQVSVVTGGSAGLGLTIAGALARAGSAAVLASRSAERCERAARQLAAQSGRPALATHATSPTRTRLRPWQIAYCPPTVGWTC